MSTWLIAGDSFTTNAAGGGGNSGGTKITGLPGISGHVVIH